MINELIEILKKEEEALNKLLNLLDKQFILIMEKDTFKLDAIVTEIKLCNKEVAEAEVERRKLTGKAAMSDIIEDAASDELDNIFRNIKKTIEAIKLQKDTNEMLIKQELGFTTRMLSMLTPKKEAKTYSSYGTIRR